MKKKIELLFCLCIFVCGMGLTSCSSDAENDGSGCKYNYTESELEKIQELKEDYGVQLVSMTTSSDEPLPSISEIEEIFKTVCSMQNSLKQSEMVSTNSIHIGGESVLKHVTRVASNGEHYSGEYSKTTYTAYGFVDVMATWKDVDPVSGGPINFSVSFTQKMEGASFHLVNVSNSYSGSQHVKYTVTFYITLERYSKFKSDFELKGDISL